jgi:hypothetical protein
MFAGVPAKTLVAIHHDDKAFVEWRTSLRNAARSVKSECTDADFRAQTREVYEDLLIPQALAIKRTTGRIKTLSAATRDQPLRVVLGATVGFGAGVVLTQVLPRLRIGHYFGHRCRTWEHRICRGPQREAQVEHLQSFRCSTVDWHQSSTRVHRTTIDAHREDPFDHSSKSEPPDSPGRFKCAQDWTFDQSPPGFLKVSRLHVQLPKVLGYLLKLWSVTLPSSALRSTPDALCRAVYCQPYRLLRQKANAIREILWRRGNRALPSH